ncbi:MAG: S4 domain-containing protein [Candidatus Thermoplasmatota archaeon]|jgi:small subunit ribosomal protein S4e|nr:S4 domain-containing protein [Candidatus Thermoplasmatota archaeon]
MINKTKTMMASRAIKVPRKTHFWIVTPIPGRHTSKNGIALLTVMRDYLKLGDKEREITRIISSGKVRVDGKVVRERRFNLGFMDTLSIEGLEDVFRIIYDKKGRFVVAKVGQQDAQKKLVKIVGKKAEGKDTFRVSFHDGQNIISKDQSLKPGDVLLIKTPEKSIEGILKLQPGSKVFLTGGSHVGQTATVKNVEVKESSHENMLSFEEGFGTVVDYAFPIGSQKFTFDLGEVISQ